ncbi:hypothetical protein PR048_022710 [Dryococelus australis]|uniref:HAT C-terminal dimerisation domain-containing protein n=1 Tax=Dryococelus australis TaxID=614101 RepID=A0ABQ9GS35_9NEOP|nr:hypothetical protein PR048_022710 [Dryococelus australis]
MLRIFFTTAISNASCERSFSKLFKINNEYYKRLTNLAILSIEQEHSKNCTYLLATLTHLLAKSTDVSGTGVALRCPQWIEIRGSACMAFKAGEGEARWEWSIAGIQGRGKQEIPDKTRRLAASSGTIPTCENPGATPPGNKPGSPKREASSLTTKPPRPLMTFDVESAVSIYLCFTAFGVGPLVFVRGSMNTEAYCNILDNEMLPTVWRFYGMDPCYFQDDNARCHVSRATMQLYVACPEPRPQPYRTSLGRIGSPGEGSSGAAKIHFSTHGMVARGMAMNPRGCPANTRREHARQGGCCYSRKRWTYEILTGSTQKIVAPFEFRARLEIEMFISNRRNRRFQISIRDQQPSSTNEVGKYANR